jgi:hypothetical protein
VSTNVKNCVIFKNVNVLLLLQNAINVVNNFKMLAMIRKKHVGLLVEKE